MEDVARYHRGASVKNGGFIVSERLVTLSFRKLKVLGLLPSGTAPHQMHSGVDPPLHRVHPFMSTDEVQDEKRAFADLIEAQRRPRNPRPP